MHIQFLLFQQWSNADISCYPALFVIVLKPFNRTSQAKISFPEIASFLFLKGFLHFSKFLQYVLILIFCVKYKSNGIEIIHIFLIYFNIYPNFSQYILIYTNGKKFLKQACTFWCGGKKTDSYNTCMLFFSIAAFAN